MTASTSAMGGWNSIFPIREEHEYLPSSATAVQPNRVRAVPLTSVTAIEPKIQNGTDFLVQKVAECFGSADATDFEDGMDNVFRQGVRALARRHGSPVIDAIKTLIETNRVSPTVVAETARYLGEMNHPTTYRSRLDLLIGLLSHQSAKVRDGAGVGLAFMDDPVAIPYLKRSIKNERNEDLRKDLQLVLAQLEDRA